MSSKKALAIEIIAEDILCSGDVLTDTVDEEGNPIQVNAFTECNFLEPQRRGLAVGAGASRQYTVAWCTQFNRQLAPKDDAFVRWVRCGQCQDQTLMSVAETQGGKKKK